MKALVVYSSLTGNTRKIAQAMALSLAPMSTKCQLASVEEAPEPGDFDLLALGYWVDKGMPDSKSLVFMEKIRNRQVVLFGTLGAWPHSDHARECMEKSEALLSAPEKGNTILGSFLCQGKVDPKIVSMMQKMASSQHPMTDERKARLEEAAKHPNEEDCQKARKFIEAIGVKLGLAQA